MSVVMSDGGFSFKIRTQFSFIVNDPTLSSILGGIAKQGINVTGFLQTKPVNTENTNAHNYGSDQNIVRLVVGSPDSENSSDLLGARKVLDNLDVEFQEKPVIQVVGIPPGVPGIFNSIFGALWCKVMVYAMYVGELTRLILDTSDILETLLILSRIPLPQCPKQCCQCQPEKTKKIKRI